ncbi:serine carboxypeptidase-like 2 [Malania oleifera]|uniref:serine carboxypeptidase-like 2 n=1 Tax=Malania oleifera TaxID=397392 RepID=UPI0025AEB45B|nr:serine carboxypeptidase-like 2 [Malania oleifera]
MGRRVCSNEKSHSAACSLLHRVVAVVVVLQQLVIWSVQLINVSAASSYDVESPVIRFLPGFQGPLPFQLHTGYVGVDESEEVQLFYYFVESESDPKQDPLLIWFTGGPGCSSFSALFFEIGPLYFEAVEYRKGSVPTLVLNPNSWTQVASIIFVDFPVGTGFSYAKTSRASHSTDLRSSLNADQFLRKWLIDHPEFLSNPVYVGGDSYSGITVPLVFHQMSDGNEGGLEPIINLKGYLLGNPVTSPAVDGNFGVPFAHGMGLISDELYESLKKSCKGRYINVDPKNTECLKHIISYYKCLTGLQVAQILEPLCGFASPKPQEILSTRKSLRLRGLLDPEPPFPPLDCRIYAYLLSDYWVKDDSVQDALHIRKGSVGEWQRCNFALSYTIEISDSFQYHVNLSAKGYRSLIYSGDHDLIVPFLGTQAWIRSLNYSIVDDWRPWMVEGQVGGYTRTYSNRMTFATVKGGGHTAPEYKPKECFAMFRKWICEEPL